MGLLKQVCLNNIEAVEKCLTRENANTKDSGGNTALHLAAEKGLLEIGRLLVERGADVNARNDSPGWTPLHFAAYEGHLELVKLFLNEADAHPSIKDNQGSTPETWALEWENYKCAMVISEAVKRRSSEISSSDEEDECDDDDDEEMSHWVLPLPTVIPKDLSKPNIHLLSSHSMAEQPEVKKQDVPSISEGQEIPKIVQESSEEIVVGESEPSSSQKGLSIVDQIKDSLSPDKTKPPPTSEQGPLDLEGVSKEPDDPNLVSLDPIYENSGAVGQTPSQKSTSSPNLRRKNSSDSASNIDKQLRCISKDKAFSRDLRGSAADIISMTNKYGDLARISRVKEDLLKKLDYLIEEERRQLEIDLSKKLEELERMKRRHKEAEERMEFEISLLSEKLENLTLPPAFSRGPCFSPPNIEKDITCVGCSRICVPPAKIFQCEEGDILCQDCRDDKRMSHCPECGIQVLRGLSRNKALEKLARKHYDC